MDNGQPCDAVQFFWCLVEAKSRGTFEGLWPDLARQQRQLVALARERDLSVVLQKLVAGLAESELLGRPFLATQRNAIFEALCAASVVTVIGPQRVTPSGGLAGVVERRSLPRRGYHLGPRNGRPGGQ
jgi:hypothetical protein